MTSNDKQMDLLLRRYGQRPATASGSAHLDADELSAFAEGALPPATRARYVSHLADCEPCRKQASALAISSGAMVRAEESSSSITEGRTFWQTLTGLFALPVLRYAAFGAVLLIVAGVAFIALRRPSGDSPLVAVNEPANRQPESAVKPPANLSESAAENKQTNDAQRSTSPSQGLPATENSKSGEARSADDRAATVPPAMKEAPPPAPVTAEKKADQAEVAQAAPSYAPQPPGESAQQKSQVYRDQQSVAGISGPRQQQKIESNDKLAAQDRERDSAKDAMRTDAPARKAAPMSVASAEPTNVRRAADEKAKGPMRNMESNTINRNEAANRAEPPKPTGAGADRSGSTEESAQTRSAGGRKFRRQGNAWVDQKFKSSMTLRNVARGSDEFAALDSGLRSIAQQFSGEVIVVWKGKAYLIK